MTMPVCIYTLRSHVEYSGVIHILYLRNGRKLCIKKKHEKVTRSDEPYRHLHLIIIPYTKYNLHIALNI